MKKSSSRQSLTLHTSSPSLYTPSSNSSQKKVTLPVSLFSIHSLSSEPNTPKTLSSPPNSPRKRRLETGTTLSSSSPAAGVLKSGKGRHSVAFILPWCLLILTWIMISIFLLVQQQQQQQPSTNPTGHSYYAIPTLPKTTTTAFTTSTNKTTTTGSSSSLSQQQPPNSQNKTTTTTINVLLRNKNHKNDDSNVKNARRQRSYLQSRMVTNASDSNQIASAHALAMSFADADEEEDGADTSTASSSTDDNNTPDDEEEEDNSDSKNFHAPPDLERDSDEEENDSNNNLSQEAEEEEQEDFVNHPLAPKDRIYRPLPPHLLTANTTTTTQQQQQQQFILRPSRVLVGIFTMDTRKEYKYRHYIRKLLKNFRQEYRQFTSGDPNSGDIICSLFEYKIRYQAFQKQQQKQQQQNEQLSFQDSCEIIYTFVGGAPKEEEENHPSEADTPDDDSPTTSTATMIVKEEGGQRFLQKRPVTEAQFSDWNAFRDMTLLNVQENMNDGKSETWLAYGLKVMNNLEIDYIAKSDTDTLIYVDQLLAFKQQYLPPFPYAARMNVLVGYFVDKFVWNPHELSKIKYLTREQTFKAKYGYIIHLYAQGQFYLFSSRLAQAVVDEAPYSKRRGYLEMVEDHDISAMAFQTNQPIQLILMAIQERFWRHPIKDTHGKERFNQVWQEERIRLERVFNTTSSGNTASSTSSATSVE